MRHLYNLFTVGGVHYIPDGGMLDIRTENGGYYTFRTQANYAPTFGGKHTLEVSAGFEFRETKRVQPHRCFSGMTIRHR